MKGRLVTNRRWQRADLGLADFGDWCDKQAIGVITAQACFAAEETVADFQSVFRLHRIVTAPCFVPVETNQPRMYATEISCSVNESRVTNSPWGLQC